MLFALHARRASFDGLRMRTKRDSHPQMQYRLLLILSVRAARSRRTHHAHATLPHNPSIILAITFFWISFEPP
jgi:hypothetical protein